MTPSRLNAQRLIVDHRTGLLTIERPDGTLEVHARQVRAPQGAIEILRSEYDVVGRELHLTLPAGARVTVEVGSSGATRQSLGRRRVVYLDQNHWIALARRRYSPEKQDSAINEAAEKLMVLAESKNIVLPLSAAHLVEAARSDGRFRRNLATTMLSLSRGWQMRNPMQVRAHELATSIQGCEPAAPDVMTLEPGVVFGTGPETSDVSNVPELAAELHRRITTISAIFDVMIEDEKDDSEQGRALAATWARLHEDLARRLRDDRVPKHQIRTITLAFFFSDLTNDFARAGRDAGLAPADLALWMERDADTAIARMPHLGRFRELLLKRLRNADERWEPNDLIDSVYLSCAAGYADLVVGEKKHTNLLMQTMSAVAPGAHLEWKLPKAVAWLERTQAPEPFGPRIG